MGPHLGGRACESGFSHGISLGGPGPISENEGLGISVKPLVGEHQSISAFLYAKPGRPPEPDSLQKQGLANSGEDKQLSQRPYAIRTMGDMSDIQWSGRPPDSLGYLMLNASPDCVSGAGQGSGGEKSWSGTILARDLGRPPESAGKRWLSGACGEQPDKVRSSTLRRIG